MNRGATIFLLVAAAIVVACAVILIPMKFGGGKPVGSALFAFDPDDVSLIKITNGDEVIELRRTDDGWYLGPEPHDRASAVAVRRVIETALSTPILDRMDAGEISDRDELSLYGLKKSRVQLDFRGDRDLSLLIGKDAADETRNYVRFEDSRDVYLIPDALINVILSSPEDFRDRMPARLRPDRVDRVVISRPAGEIELRRETSGWKIVKPLSAPASTAAIETFLGNLLRQRIEGFELNADAGVTGLSEPTAEVRLFGQGESTPETLRIGSPAPSGGIYARLEPRGVTVRLPAEIRDVLAFDLTSLRDKALAHINLDLVDRIQITTPAGCLKIRRNGDDGWIAGDRPVSADAMDKMVEAFAATESDGFEPATAEGLEKAGLNTPSVVVEFFSVVSENTPETTAGSQLVESLKFGAKSESGRISAIKSGSPEITHVPEAVLKAIPTAE